MSATANEEQRSDTERQAVNIIHFSDVHDINGASRFLSALNVFREQKLEPLVFFSGNFISQSDLSCVTRGEHMIDIMNRLGITCATLGHHDFDFGERNAFKIIGDLSFPVIHTNLLFDALPLDANTNKPLISKHLVIHYTPATTNTDNRVEIIQEPSSTAEVTDDDTLKIGVIGVCENWLHLLENSLDDAARIHHTDMIEATQTYIDKLRDEYHVDMIIALTHSKLLNDRVLADKINGIDLILSGRDHIHTCSMTNHTRTLIVKSGANFNQFSWIQFMRKKQHKAIVDSMDDERAHTVSNTLQSYLLEEEGLFKARKYWYKVRYYEVNETMQDDDGMKQMVDAVHRDYNKRQLDQTFAEIACNLDCTQFSLLNGECNSANFVSDIIRAWCKSDCVILSATTFLSLEEKQQQPQPPLEAEEQEQEQEQSADAKTETEDAFPGLSEASISAFNVDGSVNRGGITYRDILHKVLCDDGAIIVLKLTGSQIRRAIEHGLSKTEDMTSNERIDGVTKWPHVSGLRFVYDPMEPNGTKIKTIWIWNAKAQKYVELATRTVYSVATSHELAMNGADGYTIFDDPVSIERDDKESVNGQMMLISFLRQINYINKLKLLATHARSHSSSQQNLSNKRANRKEIESKIKGVGLRSKALAACVETKWVSSFQVITRENTKEDLYHAIDANDEEEEEELEDKRDNDDNVDPELVFNPRVTADHESNTATGTSPPQAAMDENSSNSGNVELGGNYDAKVKEEEEAEEIVNIKTEEKTEENGGAETKEESEMQMAPQSHDGLSRKKSLNVVLKEKIQNIDKEGMKQRLNDMKRTSKMRLNIMGQKLKQIAIESGAEMGKLSEKAKQFISKEKEIRYDENGNILDVEIFVVKPKIDHRVMTVDDEKRWLKLRGDEVYGNPLYVKQDVVIDNHSLNARDNEKRKKTSDEMDIAQHNNNNNNSGTTMQRRASLAKLLFVTKSKSISSEIFKKIEFKKPNFNKKKSKESNENNEKNANLNNEDEDNANIKNETAAHDI